MSLVIAYDKRTGKALPNLVPDHYFDHPRLGLNLSRTKPTPEPESESRPKPSPKKEA